MVKRTDPEYNDEAMVPFGHRIKAGLRDRFNKTAPPRQAGATFSKLVEIYLEDPSILEGPRGSRASAYDAVEPKSDFNQAGLIGILHDYDTCDFSDLIQGAGDLIVFGNYLSPFLSFRDHGRDLLYRLGRPEFRTRIIFGDTEDRKETMPHEHDVPHYKELLNQLPHRDGNDAVKVISNCSRHLPHFAVVADDASYAAIAGFGSSYLLHWVSIEGPCYHTALRSTLSRASRSR
ncbi:hypothetical protein J2766_001100 [Agrobacterium tumefaciens]|uniref:Uncharacterized protein n=1 Tax=Agrobacterium tumefaciens TaxID=358 RepID=A0AAW8LQY7_AGRTU|nr:hypothetical protein [Agrobacterium tumefaciens]MBP2564541.1 hypothetical protein [Agrobacterium tumefaciens]MDR6701594.1 hypothetical protein [Agrobacterium tumefaciens]